MKLELWVFSQPYSKLYPLRLFELLRFMHPLIITRQFRIFLKSMIDFLVYMKPYIVISSILIISNTVVSLQYISPAGMVWPYTSSEDDLLPGYLITATKVLLTSGTGTLQARTSFLDGHGWALYFIFQSLLVKYFIDNCFVAIYIYIYASLVKQYADRLNTIPLDFEKSTWQKKAMLSRSVFFGAARKKKEMEEKKAAEELETKRKLLLEAKARSVMRGVEGQRLFTSALNRIFNNSKKKRATLGEVVQNEVKEFNVIDESSHRGRRVSSQQNPRPSIRLKQGGVYPVSNFLKNRLTLNLDDSFERPTSDNNLMTDRTENLPTSETSKEVRRNQKSSNSKSHTLINSKRLTSNIDIPLQNSTPSNKTGIERARSSNPNWNSPGRKSRLLRKLSILRETIKITKPSKLIIWFSTPFFKRTSTIAISLLAISTTFTLKPLACQRWVGFFPVLSFYALFLLYFIFENCCLVIFPSCQAYIELKYHRNASKKVDNEGTSKPGFRSLLKFSWFGLLMALGNLAYLVTFNLHCTSSDVGLLILQVIICLNYLLVITRIHEFKTIVIVQLKMALRFLNNMAVIFVSLLIVSVMLTDIFAEGIMACESEKVERAHFRNCSLYSGQLQSFRLNYDSVGKSLIATHFGVDRVDWFNLVELGRMAHKVQLGLYHVIHYGLLFLLATYFNMIMRGLVVGLCYVTNERLSVVNIDESLSKAEKEMVLTEERFIKTKLLVRYEKNKSSWSEVANLIALSWIWRGIFDTIALIGFILNLTIYIGEPSSLKLARSVLNLVFLAMVNINTLLLCLSNGLKLLFSCWSGSTKMILTLIINVGIIVAVALSTDWQISILLSYLGLFQVLEDMTTCMSHESAFFMKLKQLSNQIWHYFKVLLFALLMVATSMNLVIFIATIDNRVHSYSIIFYAGSLLAILFDSQWTAQITKFSNLYSRFSYAGFAAATGFIYAATIILKQLVFSYFFSEIIRRSTLAASAKEFVYSDDLVEQLLSVWRVYDPAATGMISPKDYISFLLDLKPPLSLAKDELKKLLKATAASQQYIYRQGYPNQTAEQLATTPGSAKVEHAELITRRVFIQSRDKSIDFTVEDFCNYCRVYNVPLYKVNDLYWVHWRDVCRVVVRISLETIHDDKLTNFKENKKLQSKLDKEWIQKYPKLSSLKDSLNAQCFDRRNSKFPHFHHFDLLYYHAAQSLQKLHKKEQAIRDTKLALFKSRKLAAFPDYDEESENKITKTFQANRDFLNRQVYDKLFNNHQANLNLKKNRTFRSPAFASRNISRLNSPELKHKSPLFVQRRQLSSGPGLLHLEDKQESEPTDRMDDAEIIRDIEVFDNLGFQKVTRKLSASSSFSSSKEADPVDSSSFAN